MMNVDDAADDVFDVVVRFLILRTSILVTERELEKMTNMLDTILSHRLVTMILKQL